MGTPCGTTGALPLTKRHRASNSTALDILRVNAGDAGGDLGQPLVHATYGFGTLASQIGSGRASVMARSTHRPEDYRIPAGACSGKMRSLGSEGGNGMLGRLRFTSSPTLLTLGSLLPSWNSSP